jgi:regulator of RNase E activity RraA
MSVQQYTADFKPLSAEVLQAFADIPAAVASDCLARGQTMQGAIGALDPSMRVLGQARTAECPVGNNSAIRAAIGLAKAGEVIVVNAQGFENTAVFGGLMTLYAQERGIAGLVIDGAVRDSDEIVDADLPMFARAVCPRGPVKEPAGYVDGTVAVGGVSVAPGDLIIGDAAGVTVVPWAQVDACLAAAQEVLRKEAAILETIKAGGTLADIYGVVEIVPAGKA